MEIDKNSNLIDMIEPELVINSPLEISELKKNGDVVVIKSGMHSKDCIKEYMDSHPDYKNVIFYYCTEFYNQYKAWYSIFKNIQPFYAMKCNSDPVIIDFVSKFPGICVCCGSTKEIQMCLDRGIRPEQIIYANPIKSEVNIRFAADKGVWCGTLDSIDEVHKIHSVLGERASNCRIVLRIWVDDSHSACPLVSKFGCMEEEDAIMEACKNYNMQIVGVAFHVGSRNDSADAHKDAIIIAKRVFDKGKEYGFVMNLLDFGGGWSGKLADDKMHNEWLEKASDTIHETLEETGFNAIPNVKYISEPGRYFNNHTIDVCCRVVNVQERNGCMVYRINEGVDTIFKDYFLCNELDFDVEVWAEGELFKTIFVGPSGKPYDKIDHLGVKKHMNDVYIDIMLPRLKIGDYVLFRHIGAYTVSLSTRVLRDHQKHCYLVHESSLK